MLDGTLIVIISDHGGWRNHHGYSYPFSALVDIPILIRGKWLKADFHSVQNVVRSTFSERFLLNYKQ